MDSGNERFASVANVSKDQLEQKAEGDLGRVLKGKASGVQIQQQSGMSGSGTSIIIRGMRAYFKPRIFQVSIFYSLLSFL